MLTAAMMPVYLTAPLDLRGDNVENVRVISPSHAERSGQPHILSHRQRSGLTERCHSKCRSGRPGLPVPNSSYGLCWRKATLNEQYATRTCLGGASVCSSDSDRPSQFSQYRLNDHISLTQSFSLSESWTFLPSDVAWCPRVSADILGRDKPLRQCVRKAYCFTASVHGNYDKAARRRQLLSYGLNGTESPGPGHFDSVRTAPDLWVLNTKPMVLYRSMTKPRHWLIEVATSQLQPASLIRDWNRSVAVSLATTPG